MLSQTRYKGIEKVFTQEQQLLRTKAEFRKAAEEGRDNFLRLLRIEPPLSERLSLPILIERAEDEFRAIAMYTGSRLVKHELGLYRLPWTRISGLSSQIRLCERLGAPENHVLAAEVEVVRSHRQVNEKEHLYSDLIFHSTDYIQAERPYKLRDIGPQQFVVDLSKLSTPDTTPGKNAVVFVDIEPRFLN